METQTRRLALELILVLLALTGTLALIGLGNIELPTARAASFHVCPPGSGPCDYTSIQAAVDAAGDGDLILIATGVYTGVSTREGVTQTLYLSKSLTLQGGYTTTDWTTPYPITQPTTLDARGQGRVIYVVGNITTTLEGLRITGGDAGSANGGGVYILTATATLSNSRVFSNAATSGGGIWCSGTLVLSHTDALSNTATGILLAQGGGGVYVHSGSAMLNGGRIVGNSTKSGGGGVDANSGSATISGTQILSNTALFGGGVLVGEGNVTLSKLQIFGNTATDAGGVFVASGSATLSDVAIISNTGNGHGGGVVVNLGSMILNGGQILANYGGSGGGVFLAQGRMTLSGGQIVSNTAQYGGGVFISIMTGTLTQTGADSVIAYNSAAIKGGGVWIEQGQATLNGGQILSNTAGQSGGGVYVVTGSATLNGEQIVGNTASQGGGLFSTGTTVMTDTTVRHNTGGGLVVEGGTMQVYTGTIEANGVGLAAGGPLTGSLVAYNTVISGNLTAGLAYAGTTPFTLTLGGAPEQANVFRNNGPSSHVNITVSAPSGRPPISAFYTDWGVTGLTNIEATLLHQFDDPSLARVDYYTLTLNTAPPSQLANGVLPVNLTATLTSLLNEPPGDVISFTTSLGTLSAPTATTNSSHQASVSLTSVATGTAWLTATAGVDPIPARPGMANVVFVRVPDLVIRKAVAPDQVVLGQPLTYTLTFSNTGTDTATGILITDVVPITLTNVSYLASGVAVTPTGSVSYTWQVADLPPDAGGVITLTGIVSPGVQGVAGFINTASITGTTAEVDTADNSSSVGVTVLYRLAVNRAGNGSGTVSNTPSGSLFNFGTVVTLTAAPSITSTFTGWSGRCSGTGLCVVTMTANTNVTATFTAITRALTVNLTGTGSGSVTSAPAGINCPAGLCSTGFVTGTVVTLVATPSLTSTFAGWSGRCTGTATCVVTMTANTLVTATFTVITRALTVNLTGTGNGNVTSAPAGINCPAGLCSTSFITGTVVTLAAAPSLGSTFTGWSGGKCSGTGLCVVTMTANSNVTATFVLNTYTLTVSYAGNGNGSVTTNPTGPTFTYGTVVTLTAHANPASSFSGWSPNCTVAGGDCVVTITANTLVTATFSTHFIYLPLVMNNYVSASDAVQAIVPNVSYTHAINAFADGHKVERMVAGLINPE